VFHPLLHAHEFTECDLRKHSHGLTLSAAQSSFLSKSSIYCKSYILSFSDAVVFSDLIMSYDVGPSTRLHN